MPRLFRKASALRRRHHRAHVAVGAAGVYMPALAPTAQDGVKVGAGALIADMQRHAVSPGDGGEVVQITRRAARRRRIVKREFGADPVQPVRHGDHRGDADAAAHQEGLGRGLFQRKMVDRLRYENLPPRREDPVQER